MVGTCVVYGCTNRQEKGGNISFFHFPHKNPPVLKQWANAVNRLHCVAIWVRMTLSAK